LLSKTNKVLDSSHVAEAEVVIETTGAVEVTGHASIVACRATTLRVAPTNPLLHGSHST